MLHNVYIAIKLNPSYSCKCSAYIPTYTYNISFALFNFIIINKQTHNIEMEQNDKRLD